MCAPQSFCVLIDSNGKVVVQYYYDAWGSHKVVTADGNAIASSSRIGNINPFRYRGYYYDTETGLYFLQTRYYDPETGRFLNRDSVSYAGPETIGGLNLYAYCLNNPVMYVDPSGYDEIPWWGKLLIGIGFIVVGAVVTALTAGTGVGFLPAFGSALLSSTIQVGISTGISSLISGTMSAINGDGFLSGFTEGLVDGFMWGSIFAGGAQLLGGAFRASANFGFPTGRKGGINFWQYGLKVLSPDKNNWAKAGGTILKFRYEFRLDVGAHWGLHMHIFSSTHLPIGVVLAGIIGGF